MSIPENFEFKAGQYVSLSILNDGKKIRKPFSIASAPSKEKYIELCIKLLENSNTSRFVQGLQKGDKAELFGPAGKFILEKNSFEKDLIFVAVGTGITPFRSMINYLLRNGFNKKIILIKGFRTEKNSLYDGEFSELQSKYGNFEFHNILSRPESQSFENKGYIQDFIKKYLPENFQGHAYICGLYQMIDAVRSKLISLGVKEKDIFFEKYD